MSPSLPVACVPRGPRRAEGRGGGVARAGVLGQRGGRGAGTRAGGRAGGEHSVSQLVLPRASWPGAPFTPYVPRADPLALPSHPEENIKLYYDAPLSVLGDS